MWLTSMAGGTRVGVDDQIKRGALITGDAGFSFRAPRIVKSSVLFRLLKVPGLPSKLSGQLDSCECTLSGLLCISLGASHF